MAPHARRCVRAHALHVHLGALAQLHDLAQHLPLAYERVVYPCSSVNCGDMLYRRCEGLSGFSTSVRGAPAPARPPAAREWPPACCEGRAPRCAI